MYNGIGLQTPRGSATNGYVQRSKFFARRKTNTYSINGRGSAGVTRKPNKEMFEHDRKRLIQLNIFVLEEKLIDLGYSDAEIAEKLDQARKSLEAKDLQSRNLGEKLQV
ncbi:UNVERIFIED_CONTAM: Serine/arginine repetitive matrix protein 2 [Sesamum latifolium]|uniref:Serine/arginine repetitive matrix protein 2 n=1 Tax=Sesamum latifolium TaxID=2727402 RepID=A0AAW2X223_9LAMI